MGFYKEEFISMERTPLCLNLQHSRPIFKDRCRLCFLFHQEGSRAQERTSGALPLHPGTHLTLAYLSPNLCLLTCHSGEAARCAWSRTRPAPVAGLQGRGQPRGPRALARLFYTAQHSTGIRGHLARLRNYRHTSSSHRFMVLLSFMANTLKELSTLISDLSFLILKWIGLLSPLFHMSFTFHEIFTNYPLKNPVIRSLSSFGLMYRKHLTEFVSFFSFKRCLYLASWFSFSPTSCSFPNLFADIFPFS